MLGIESYKSFSLNDELTITEGKGGLPFITIDNEYASAVISIYAAHVLSYKAKNSQNDLLFLSDLAQFEKGKAIRGGIPLCWPWFGKDPNPKKKQHGFARLMLWDLIETQSLSDGSTQVSLSLTESEETLKIWPHRFNLTLTLIVGKTLMLSLKSVNTGDVPFVITQAIHSYFSVSDVAQVNVEGLDRVNYLDKASVAIKEENVQSGPVTIDKEVDRIYTDSPSEVSLIDPAADTKLTIKSKGSKTTVVWNPWAELSKKSAELSDDAYQEFICVETVNAVDDAVEIESGKSHTIEVEYFVC